MSFTTSRPSSFHAPVRALALALTLAIAGLAQPSRAQTPAAWWQFEEGAGTLAMDSSGNHFSLNMVSASWDSAPPVGLYAMTGNRGYAQMNGAAVNTTASYTAAAWVKSTQVGATQAILAIDGRNNSAFRLWLVQSKFAFTRSASDATTAATTGVTAPNTAAVNTWYHVAGVYDRPRNKMTLYINGVAVASATDATAPWQGTQMTAVGRWWLGGNPVDAFVGSIDDARLYNVALTPVQIRALANSKFQPTFRLTTGIQTLGIAKRGESTSYTINVSAINGFAAAVTFSAANLPAGVTASFSPPSSATGTTMTLTAASNAAMETASVSVVGTSGASTRTATVALIVTSADAGDAFAWSGYNPDLNYDFSVDYPSVSPPTQYLPDLLESSIKDSYADGWWCFRGGVDANPLVVPAAYIPMVNRLNNDFAWFRDVMHFPPDKRAREGYYSSVYLYGSDLRLANGSLMDGASNTDTGGWQGSVRYDGQDWPDILASYYPVNCFNPAYAGGDGEYQRSAMVHEGIHAMLTSMPGCRNAAWFHEGGNTVLQARLGASFTGDYSSMGWLSAGSVVAPFLPIEVYTGWLTDGSFGGPSAEGVYQGKDASGATYTTWFQVMGGVQYSEAFGHYITEIVSPGALAWIWQHCTNRVLEGMALVPGGLGDAQTRRLIMEYRARGAFCDYGRMSGAYLKMRNDNWNHVWSPEGTPVWIQATPWTVTCYQTTTNNNGVLTPNPATTPGWSGANYIPLTVTSAGTVTVTFQPLGNSLIVSGATGVPIANTGTNPIYPGNSTTPIANPTVPSNNMTCQLVYRATDGSVVYGQPVSSGTCSVRLTKPPKNNVVVAVICNTDYLYQGESSRLTKFDYRLTLGSGVTGTANVNTKWYDAVPSPVLRAIAGDGEVSLNWGAITGATSYTIKRSSTPGGPYTTIGTSTKTCFTNTGLTNGQAYYYVATVTTSAGTSPDSVVSSATPAAPLVAIANSGFEAPTTSTYAFNPTGGSWTFTASTTTGGSGLSANNSTYTSKNLNAPQGNQVAILEKVATISQNVSGFTPGAKYTIRFLASQRQATTQLGNTFDLKVDGTTIKAFYPFQAGSGYAEYSATFTATAATHTISFVGTNKNGGENAVFLDRVLIGPG